MGPIASAARLRHDLSARLDDARARTDELFAIVRNEFMYDRPISERHRIIFYVGHLEAFDWPQRDEITSYVHAVREKLDEAMNEALSKPDKGHPQLKTMLEVAVEHRLTHAKPRGSCRHG